MVKRSEKLAFMGVKNGETKVYKRMKNFTDMSTSKNAKEYSRQYVDEEFERSDIIGYATSISYNFDYDAENEVHKALVNISDNEMIGDGALVEIVVVDLASEGQDAGSFKAIKRQFTVVPDSEGNSMDAYTYGGTFKSNGDKIFGEATTLDEWQIASFTQA